MFLMLSMFDTVCAPPVHAPPPSYEDVCFDGQTLDFIEGEPKDDATDGFWAGESESDHT